MAVTDLPDFTRLVVHKYVGGITGLEELAARLGSIVPYSLLGNMIYMEDFETEETEWTLAYDGGDSVAERQTRHKYNGNWAMKLLADDVDGAYAEIGRLEHIPNLAKYAQFGRFKWDSNLSMLTFKNHFKIEDTNYYVGMRYTLPTTTLEVENGDDSWVSVATDLSIGETTAIWYPITLVYDLVNLVYDKVKIAEYEYDLSAYTIGTA